MRAALALVLLLALPGCSLLAPKLEKPKLSIVGVELQKGDLFEQRLKVRVRVQNPNDRGLPVKGLSYQLLVAGEELANGVSAAGFNVPARGEAEFDMNVTANLVGIASKLASRRDGPRLSDELPYHLVGKVELSRGLLRTIPFDEKGALRLK
jgi:LEA14-like dessication related protein